MDLHAAIQSLKVKDRKLPKVFKERWVAALKSGNYHQGNNFLFNGDKVQHCCLGVACEITGTSRENLKDFELPFDFIDSGNTVGRLPKLLQQAWPENVTTTQIENGFYKTANLVAILATANDQGLSFQTIAEAIELYC